MAPRFDPSPENGYATLDPIQTSLTLLSDQELLQQFAAGQRRASDELLRRYQSKAYRVAYRILRNQADAHDAVQEGFAKAFTHLLDFQQRSSFKTWLLRIVSNAAWLLLRKRKQQKASIRSDEILHACDPRTPLDHLIQQEMEVSAKEVQTAIRRAIMLRATEDMGRLFRLRIEGCTFKAIAEELGCCEKTARSIWNRLRSLLVEELAALGYSLR